MSKSKKRIGLDVGGSHVSAGLIDNNNQGQPPLHLIRKDINAFDTASIILESITSCIQELIVKEPDVAIVGIAFPGPFDYAKGVSKIASVGGKFEKIFGLHVQEALKNSTGLTHGSFCFLNDAHCFAAGSYHRHQLSSKRALFLTIGTGFGSAFMENAELSGNHPALSGSGGLFDKPFLNAQADDYFSTRWFLNEYKLKTGKEISSVKELVAVDNDMAAGIFDQFGFNLASFLLPLFQQYACDELVIGGNIAKAHALFSPSLRKHLQQSGNRTTIIFCDDTEECILTGAAILAEEKIYNKLIDTDFRNKRKATQPLLPISIVSTNDTGYNVFPTIPSKKQVYKGFESLAETIQHEPVVIIDGFGGVLWELFREQLNTALLVKNKKVLWYDINACLKPADEIDGMIQGNLNEEDNVFGKKYKGSLVDFFDRERLQMIRPDPAVDMCIVYGTGAALSNWKGLLLYADVPKNEIQYRMRADSILNIGSKQLYSYARMYKRLYFVDWPVLNKHKEQLLPAIDCIVDEQRINEITWMRGNDFRSMLDEILDQSFRARPWFEAGVWGGHWMKNNFKGLNENEINYAWSFELITPENGIVIEGNQYLLEISFDFLLFHDHYKLLGKAARRFGHEFPIRFDFLDTYVGGNLSIQCHPRTDYIRENFGENFTQDETYYILDCEPGAKVYLGFQDDINPETFKAALLDAQDNSVELPVEKFVQKIDTNKHDLFLIPNGTIHASGKNNLVLEISSTPYIFTFKMYDWLRMDLNGQPRPINIEYAFDNLYFDRKGDYVSKHLISKPQVTEEWGEGRRLKLPTHEEHFYTVDRYEFTGTVEINTYSQCHICMLVEGDVVDVVAGNKTNTFSFAETFVIPAAVGKYTIHYRGREKAFLVVAYIKDECC